MRYNGVMEVLELSKPLERMNRRYTFQDYLAWDDQERWELIEGVPSSMTHSPSPEHQRISGELFFQFRSYLHGKECQVFFAPFDVRLPELNESDGLSSNVVQPDLLVICDPNKIDERGCKGAPDFIIEILSPATAKKDITVKLRLYERFQVKEYWIVDPANQYVQVYLLKDGGYSSPVIYSKEEQIPVQLFSDLTIELSQIFP